MEVPPPPSEVSADADTAAAAAADTASVDTAAADTAAALCVLMAIPWT